MSDTPARDQTGHRIQTVTTAGVVALAVGAFLLSYDALHQLARTSHVPALLAWLWPLIVDGFILVASLAVVDAVHTGHRARYPWLLVLAFSTLSVTFNVLHAPHHPVAQLVAAIPPLALVLSFELLMRRIHHRLQHGPPGRAHPSRPDAGNRQHLDRAIPITYRAPAMESRRRRSVSRARSRRPTTPSRQSR